MKKGGNEQGFLEKLTESSQDIYFGFDVYEGQYVYFSEKIDLYHISREKILADKNYLFSLLTPEHRESISFQWINFLSDEKESGITLVYSLINQKNEHISFRDKRWKSYSSQGDLNHVFGRLTIIKDNATKTFPFSFEQVKNIFYTSPNPICILDTFTNQLSFSNYSFKDYFGVLEEFIIEDNLINPSNGKSYTLSDDFKNLELLFSTSIGDRFMNLNAYSYNVNGYFLTILFMYDVTNKRLVEKELYNMYELISVFNNHELKASRTISFDLLFNNLLEKILYFTGFNSGFIAEVSSKNNEVETVNVNSFCFDSSFHKLPSSGFKLNSYQLNEYFLELIKINKYQFKKFQKLLFQSAFFSIENIDFSVDNFVFFPFESNNNSTCFLILFNGNIQFSLMDLEFISPILNYYLQLRSYQNNIINSNENLNKLEHTSELYKLLADNIEDVICLLDSQYRIMYVSPSVEKLTGFRDEVFLDRKFFEFFKVEDKLDLLFKNDSQIIIFDFYHAIFSKQLKLEVSIKPIFKDKKHSSSFVCLLRDVTVKEKYMEELKMTLLKEKEINEIKSKIISLASHEIRTPLAIIQSSNEIIDMFMEDLSDPQLKFELENQCAKISSQVTKLSKLISDAFSFDQLANTSILKYEIIDVYQLVRNIVDSEFKMYNISVKSSYRKVKIYSDSYIVSKIFRIVLENAVCYSPKPNNSIMVTFSLDENWLSIFISDSGLGIPKEDQKFIFNPFFRAKNVKSIKGSGLSLSLAAELVSKISGNLSLVKSDESGSVFVLKFKYE